MDSTRPSKATAKVASAPVVRAVPDRALARVLGRLREERGLTREQLAHAAGLTTSGYVRIEAGASAPGWSTVRRLAVALDVSMADLGALVEAEH